MSKRTIIKTNTAFEFVSKKDGTKILHFYKLDNLTQNYIDDFIEIQIISNNESDVIEITDENEEIKTSSKQPEKTVKKAPEYKKIESPKKIGTKKNQEKNIFQNTSPGVACAVLFPMLSFDHRESNF